MKQPNLLILGSTSVYRKQLLEKLGIPFTMIKPECDEDTIKKQLELSLIAKNLWAAKLSEAKSQSIRADGVVITSDQTVLFDGAILGKPKNFNNAFLQLQKMQGKTHHLITAVTIKHGTAKETHVQTDVMQMRSLNDQEITGYLKLDEPFDSAGSYKIENSGITLFDQIQCSDFTGIQGLPMVWVTKKLKELQYEFYNK